MRQGRHCQRSAHARTARHPRPARGGGGRQAVTGPDGAADTAVPRREVLASQQLCLLLSAPFLPQGARSAGKHTPTPEENAPTPFKPFISSNV